MKKSFTKKPKKITESAIKKAIVNELTKKKVSKDWMAKHLIITSI